MSRPLLAFVVAFALLPWTATAGNISGGQIARYGNPGAAAPPAPGNFVAPPGDLGYDTTRDVGWKEPVYLDTSAWTKHDVTTDMGTLGCSNLDPADSADNSDQANLSCAVAALPSGECLTFPAGTYNVGAALYQSRDICMLATGAAVLEFQDSAEAAPNDPCTGGTIWNVCPTVGTGNWPSTTPITSGGAKGGTTVTVSSAAGLEVGDVVRVESTSYPAIVDPSGFQSFNRLYWGQYVRLTGVSGSNLTFAGDPLIEDLGPTGRQLADIEDFGMAHFILEGFTIRYNVPIATASSITYLSMRYVEHVQIRNNSWAPVWGSALFIANTYSGVVEGNVFEGQEKDTQYNKAVLKPTFMAQDLVIQNNRFEGPEVAIQLEAGPKRVVVAYNDIELPDTLIPGLGIVRCDRGIFLHGSGVFYSLIEGNVDRCTVHNDLFWGMQGPGNFFHANRAYPTSESNTYGFSVEDGGYTFLQRDSTYLVNSGVEFQGFGGVPFDTKGNGMYLEGNLAERSINLGAGLATSVNDTPLSTSKDCGVAQIPTSFYLTAEPSWWTGDVSLCDFGKGEGEGIGACGDDLAGVLCEIPAAQLNFAPIAITGTFWQQLMALMRAMLFWLCGLFGIVVRPRTQGGGSKDG